MDSTVFKEERVASEPSISADEPAQRDLAPVFSPLLVPLRSSDSFRVNCRIKIYINKNTGTVIVKFSVFL